MQTEVLLDDRDAIPGVRECTDTRESSGPPPDFEALFARYQPMVYGVALKFMGNPQDAEDLTQEVFTKVWKSLDGFNYSSSLKTWIYRIAVNTCIDHNRRPWKKIDLFSTAIDESIEGGVEVLVSADESAERRLIEQEEAAQVRRAITRLRPNLKAVLVLKDLEELSYDEISSVLGLSMGTISSRLNRARRALMELFDPTTRPMRPILQES